MAQNRITIPQWQGIKAGQEVETGFPGIVLTAPSEPGDDDDPVAEIGGGFYGQWVDL